MSNLRKKAVRLWLDQGFDGDADTYLPVGVARLHGVDTNKPTHLALPADLAEAVLACVGALDGLVAVQNGPPLVREEAEWQAAMDAAQAALSRLDAAGGRAT